MVASGGDCSEMSCVFITLPQNVLPCAIGFEPRRVYMETVPTSVRQSTLPSTTFEIAFDGGTRFLI